MNQDIFELAVYSYHIFRENSFEYLRATYTRCLRTGARRNFCGQCQAPAWQAAMIPNTCPA